MRRLPGMLFGDLKRPAKPGVGYPVGSVLIAERVARCFGGEKSRVSDKKVLETGARAP